MAQQSIRVGRGNRIQSPPKYAHLAQKLLRQIARKRLQPGDRLGTEFDLGRQYGVSRVTVRQALLTLEEEGYITREKARGTFVKRAVKNLPFSLVHGSLVVACSNEQASQADHDIAFAAVLKSIERAATDRGFTVQIMSFGSDPEADRSRLRELANREDIEGICTIGPCLEHYRDLLPDVPVVASCSWVPTQSPCVNPDIEGACRTCVDYLISRGHRAIAMLCGSEIGPEGFGAFARAYTAAFEAADLPVLRQLLVQAYAGEPVDRLVEHLLAGPARPTAVFAENWRICEAVLSAANRLGLHIPEDLSLLAFGRNVLQITYPLAVTAYVPDHEQIGEKAVGVFNSLLYGDTTPSEPLMVPGRLVERDSVRALDAPSGKEQTK